MANIDHSWVTDVKNLINDANASSALDRIWTKHSIYMVPALIKDLNPTAYKPQIISFGPYHYGDEKLWPMEIHKARALIHFLKRTQKPLEGFMSVLEEVADVLMDSYQRLDEWWRRERELFLRLMLVDGCFMLEVLRFSKGYRSRKKSDYALNDPIFSRHGMFHIVPHIRMDMLRIENQLPLLVLKELVAVETGRAPDDDEINRLVLDFMGLRSVPPGVGPGLHPLDLFRKSCLQDPGDRTAQDSRQSYLQRTLVPAPVFLGKLLVRAKAFLDSCRRGTVKQASPAGSSGRRMGAPETDEDHLQTDEELHPPHVLRLLLFEGPGTYEDQEGITAPRRLEGIEAPKTAPTDEQGFPGAQIIGRKPKRGEPKRGAVPSATWLVEAGICFRKSETDTLLDICFTDGVLSLPAITVDDATECVFLNLMAFERLHVGAGNEIMSYVFFMDALVDSAKDVAVLASKGIIHNAIGTDNAVAELFNSLGKYVSLDSGSGLHDVLRSVNEYYTRGWNMWRAKMIHFYFKSTWANSVAAFVFLLILTLLQTVYAVLQYHTPSS